MISIDGSDVVVKVLGRAGKPQCIIPWVNKL